MESAPPIIIPGTGATSNRRRGNRHRLNIPATLVVGQDAAVDVTVTELSVGGVGIQSKNALKMDATYQVNSFDTLIPPGMKVRIVSQRQLGDMVFEVGAEAI